MNNISQTNEQAKKTQKERKKETKKQRNKETNNQTNKHEQIPQHAERHQPLKLFYHHFYPKRSTTLGSNTNPTCDAPNPHEARHVHDVFLSKLHLYFLLRPQLQIRIPIWQLPLFPFTMMKLMGNIVISKKSTQSKHNLSEPIIVG